VLRSLLLLILAALLATGPASAEESAILWGLVLDKTGNPTPGYAVVVENTVTQATWSSPPSAASGEFQITVPAGGSYRAVAVLSRAGARFTLDPSAPVQARRPVRYRLDVTLPEVAKAEAPGASASTDPVASSGPGADDRAPWWKSPGGIAALVGIQGAIIAVLLMDDDDEPAASPSEPGR
jgi:hypothetical protein